MLGDVRKYPDKEWSLVKNAGTRTECYKGKYLCGKILQVDKMLLVLITKSYSAV